MARYIKEDDLRMRIDIRMDYRKHEKEMYKPEVYEGIRTAYGDVYSAIDATPTADVVEVVRCKDCVLHNTCITEDVFISVGKQDGFCCVGKKVE